MLKQQLQKTEEEFDKEWLLSGGSLHIGGAALNELKQFIRQAQIDAVKAFAEEIKPHLSEFPVVDRKKVGHNEQAINNLLKDI